MWYVGILVLLVLGVILVHKKYNYPSLVLFGASLWGFLHLLAGWYKIGESVLYGYVFWPVLVTDNPELVLFKFDQFMHLYTYFVMIFLIYYVIKNYFVENHSRTMISVFLIISAMGIGAINEIAEYIPVLIADNTGVGGYHNTLLDLIFNAVGAIFGVIVLRLKGAFK
ncbi:hypothetical protein CMI42_06590 [Candidatus Pacearchaeota archaeon]|nr:hypothetical protein [Candidatus Pacearchaeota archaeon]|tara:strand:- start:2270 stop:2773 length:504 start_codon:yes stop_codon:yes gene_type:complete